MINCLGTLLARCGACQLQAPAFKRRAGCALMRTGAGRGGMSGLGSVGDQIPVPLFLEEENQRLKRQLEHQRLKRQLNDCHLKQKRQHAEMRRARLGPDCAEKQQEIDDLKSQLDSEKHRLEARVAEESKKLGDCEVKVRKLEEEDAVLRGENSTLKMKEEKWKADQAEYDAKVKGLEDSLESLTKGTSEQRQLELEKVTSRNTELGTQIARLKSELAGVKRKKSDVETANEELKEDFLELQNKFTTLKAEKGGLEDEVRVKEKDLENLSTEYDNALHEKLALESQLQDLKTKVVTYDQLQDDFKVLEGKFNKVKAEKGNVEKDLKEKQEELQELGKTCDGAVHEKEKLQKELQNSQQMIASLEEELKNAVESVEDYGENWQRAWSSWKQSYANEIDTNKKRVKKTQEEIKILIEEIAQVEKGLADAVQKSPSSEAGTITVNEAEYKQLQNELQDAHRQADSLNNELKSVRKQLADAKQRLQAYQYIQEMGEEEINLIHEYKRNAEAFRKKSANLREDQNQQRLNMIEEKEKRIAELQLSIAGLEAREAELQESIEQLSVTVEERNKKNEEQLQAILDRNKAVSDLEDAKTAHKQELSALQAEMQQETAKQQQQIAQQLERIQQQQQKIMELQQQPATADSDAVKLQLESDLKLYKATYMVFRKQLIKDPAQFDLIIQKTGLNADKLFRREEIVKYLTYIVSQNKNPDWIRQWQSGNTGLSLKQIYERVNPSKPKAPAAQ